MKKNNTPDKFASFLLFSAAILWLLSLFFTAIVYDGDMAPGVVILLMGILFGWMSLTFQAYTNITFIIALIKGFKGKSSNKLAIITFFGGLSSFFLTQLQTANESSTIFAPIEAWGWGAIFWISAYALLMLHSFYLSAPQNHRLIIRLTGVIPAIWIGVFIIGKVQYANANAEEKQRVFKTVPMSEAFQVLKKGNKMAVFLFPMQIKPAIARPLSGLPYRPLDAKLLHSDNLIAFKGHITDRVGCCSTELDSLGLDLPDRYIYQDKYFADYYKFTLSTPAQEQPDYTISVYPAGENKGMQIYDTDKQKIIWQAPIRKTARKYSYTYYPDYDYHEFFAPLDNERLHLAQNQTLILSPAKVDKKVSQEENVSHFEAILPDKQTLWIDTESKYCSEDYSVLLYANAQYLLVVIGGKKVTLIDRKTYASTDYMYIKISDADEKLKTSTLRFEKIGENQRNEQQFKLTFQGESDVVAEVSE